MILETPMYCKKKTTDHYGYLTMFVLHFLRKLWEDEVAEEGKEHPGENNWQKKYSTSTRTQKKSFYTNNYFIQNPLSNKIS